MRWLFVPVYLAAAVVFVLNANAHAEGRELGMLVLTGASVAVGWATASWSTALLALVLVPLAGPFEYPDKFVLPDPLPVWFAAAIWTPLSAILIALGVATRKLWAKHRSSHTSAPQR